MSAAGGPRAPHRIDVSMIVTLHREGRYLNRTLTSLQQAAESARAAGLNLELVAVVDQIDRLTDGVLQNARLSAFDTIQRVEVDYGSPGRSRNVGCALATGTYLLHAGGADLISHSLPERMVEAAAQLGPRAILVPKFCFAFGMQYRTVEFFSQAEIPSAGIVGTPLFGASMFYHRSLAAVTGFADVGNFGMDSFEDWHFNCSAIAQGYCFVAVEGTALFCRQRQVGVSRQFDSMSCRQPPPADLFRPSVFLRTFAGEVARLEREGGQCSLPRRGSAVLQDSVYRALIARANAIDPAIELGWYSGGHVGHFTNVARPDLGLAYYRACEIAGDGSFDAVFLLPGSLAAHGGDTIACALRNFAERRPSARVLAIIDEGHPAPQRIGALPASVVQLDLTLLRASLEPEDRDVICLRLLQSCASGMPLHCAPSPFVQRFFARFAALLKGTDITCYRPADRRQTSHGGLFIDPAPFEFVSEHIDAITRIVVADQATMNADQRRLPGARGKWVLLTANAEADWWLNELHAAKAETDLRLDELHGATSELERQLADSRRRTVAQARASRADPEGEGINPTEIHATLVRRNAELQQVQAELVRRDTELRQAEAELIQRDTELRQAQAALDQWVWFQQSRTYRLMQAYVRIYSTPVIGPLLRRLRPVIRSAFRGLRRR